MPTRKRREFAKLTIRFPRALLVWARGEARRQDRSLNSFIVRVIQHRRMALIKTRTERDTPSELPPTPAA